MSDTNPARAAGAAAPYEPEISASGFVRSLGLFDSTMLVVGSMIGSGIFLVSADISRLTGSVGGLLLTWVITGALTIAAALSYGELAAMMPKAGGQYVYLRESYSPLWGFLYGWTLFLVIQTGTIAAVAVGFARYLGVLAPSISPTHWILPPLRLSAKYAISCSRQQLVGVVLIVLLTWVNTRGISL
ncbi:MAG: amino acid permease, partial [Candidatus Acidiferrales bacterium]